MCGIFGAYNLKSSGLRQEDIKPALEAMRHRGPDDDGFYCRNNFVMGMRRLSIIDLETGRQPIYDEKKRYAVILNGEIYNYVELRGKLEKRGHVFQTHTDTEVIVHLFEEKREKCVEDLNGMFAFAVWDSEEENLHVFRDRLGIKPLVYYWDGREFIFSSDLSSLRRYKRSLSLDEYSIFEYLAFDYIPCPRTIWKEVKKLPPASYIKLTKDGRFFEHKYWSVKLSTEQGTNVDKHVEHLTGLIRQSITRQMRSDVPVGTFLSGGLDSSSVVAFLSACGIKDIRTFSIGFEEGYNELPYARLVAEKFGTKHRETFLGSDKVRETISNLIPYMDEPVSDNSIIPTFILSGFARDAGVKVILNGTGGDEIFGGYSRHRTVGWKMRLLNTPVIFRRSVAGLVNLINKDKAFKIAYPETMFLGSAADFMLLSKLVSRDSFYYIANAVQDRFWASVINVKNAKDLMLFDLTDYLVDDVLSLLDKMTMAHSLEGRVPLLDHELVEYCYGIPSETLLNNGQQKYLFRQVLKNMLPDKLFSMPKRGFSGPESYWIKEALQQDIYYHLVDDPVAFVKNNISLEYLKKTLKSANPELISNHRLFALYILTLWIKQNGIA